MTHSRRAAAVVALALACAACTRAPAPPSSATSAAGTPQSASATPSSHQPAASSGATPTPGMLNPDRPTAALPDVALPGIVAAPGDTLAAYEHQTLTWNACGDLECATALAPEDYARPGWHAITLSVKRRPMAKPAALTLFVNPGGPGAGVADLVGSKTVFAGLQDAQIVGIDPRGGGDSTPVVCSDHQDQPNPVVQQRLAADESPETDAEFAALDQADAAFAASCGQKSGQYLEHVNVRDAARDLDLVRGLMGLDKVNFVGFSAGTGLGADYAELFPDHAGRLVLDGAVGINEDATSQYVGFERSFKDFLRWASVRGVLGNDQDSTRTRFADWLGGLDQQPMKAGDKTLTQSQAAQGVAAYLYGGTRYYTYLEGAISAAYQGDGSMLRRAAVSSFDPKDTGVPDQLYYSFPAIGCASGSDEGSAAARQRWLDATRDAVFSRYLGPSLMCTHWPVSKPDDATPHASVATPPLVLGTTGDPATPYENAAVLADAVGGRVFSFDGEGHTAFGSGHQCVDAVVIAYLRDGTLPAVGARCAG